MHHQIRIGRNLVGFIFFALSLFVSLHISLHATLSPAFQYLVSSTLYHHRHSASSWHLYINPYSHHARSLHGHFGTPTRQLHSYTQLQPSQFPPSMTPLCTMHSHWHHISFCTTSMYYSPPSCDSLPCITHAVHFFVQPTLHASKFFLLRAIPFCLSPESVFVSYTFTFSLCASHLSAFHHAPFVFRLFISPLWTLYWPVVCCFTK